MLDDNGIVKIIDGPVNPGGGCAAGAGMAGTLIPILALWGARRRRE